MITRTFVLRFLRLEVLVVRSRARADQEGLAAGPAAALAAAEEQEVAPAVAAGAVLAGEHTAVCPTR